MAVEPARVVLFDVCSIELPPGWDFIVETHVHALRPHAIRPNAHGFRCAVLTGAPPPVGHPGPSLEAAMELARWCARYHEAVEISSRTWELAGGGFAADVRAATTRVAPHPEDEDDFIQEMWPVGVARFTRQLAFMAPGRLVEIEYVDELERGSDMAALDEIARSLRWEQCPH